MMVVMLRGHSHSGMARKRQTRNLEILRRARTRRSSMLRIAPE